jgi:prepilin peptidase dependent protein B
MKEQSLCLRSKRAAQRGLSIVELMIGTAIGLFVVGGALKLFVDLFDNNRRQLVEVRLNQDLRAAADIIARDLRRSGYWAGAGTGVSGTPQLNPFANTTETVLGANSVTYAYDRDNDGVLTGASERAGFQLTGNVIEMRVGNAWQPLTDPNTVQITNFSIQNSATGERTVSRADFCRCVSSTGPTRCDPAVVAAGANAPQVVMRWVDILIQGRATGDNTMTRQITESVRLRNDEVRGDCPPP